MADMQLQIRSADRLSGTTTNFVVNLTRPISQKKFKLSYVSVPNYIWNVTTFNNLFQFIDSGSVLRTATITPGYYTTNALLTALQNGMNALTTDVFTISTTNFAIVISSTGLFQVNFNTSTLTPYLGFTQRSGLSTPALSLTSQNGPTLSPSTLYVNIDGFSSVIVSTNRVTASFIIPLLANNSQYNTLTEDRLMHQKIKTEERQFTTLHITMTDEFGNPITLLGEWMFILTDD